MRRGLLAGPGVDAHTHADAYGRPGPDRNAGADGHASADADSLSNPHPDTQASPDAYADSPVSCRNHL